MSADEKFNKAALICILDTHQIVFKPRPTLKHNKTGIVERKVKKIKMIVKKLDREVMTSNADMVLSRTVFISNFFSVSRPLSSFQLVRGYHSSIIGLPSRVVSQELLDVHIEQTATRAIQRALRSNSSHFARQFAYRQDDVFFVWYDSSKQNEKDMWIKAKVINVHTHYFEVKRLVNAAENTGPPIRSAYEDVRLAPKSELTQELLERSLEEELGLMDGGENVQ